MDLVNPDPSRVARTIVELAATATAPLNAYWLAVAGGRDDYAARLAPLLNEHGTAVLIVRKERFDNPNSLMADLVHILEENRPTFLAALRQKRLHTQTMSIVLLARTELAMGQSSSPVIWPDWVPGVGRQQVSCFITDITRRIDAPLNATEADAGRIHRALYAVEAALVRRLVHVSSRTPEVQQDFFHAVRRRSDAGWIDFLARAKSAVENVTDVESYRPSVRRGEAVTSRLWEVNQARPAAEVEVAARGLATALQIPERAPLEGWREGLFGVLARHTGSRETVRERFSRNAIVTVSTACQYITCAAHADGYERFPVNLLMAVVDDLHRSLVSMEVSLIHLHIDRTEPYQTSVSI
jgi:hypothetical protein